MKTKIKVIDSLWTFAIAVAFLGPFALPLLWRNPRFTTRTKVMGSIFVVLLTLFLFWIFEFVLKDFFQKIQEIIELQKQMQSQPRE
jgi:Na+/proline symporter